VIEVSDDGAGIDWMAVARRALELGVPAATPSEVRAALFVEGVTTAAQATETSGRGVGMGALSATCAALGGQVELDSELGRGTLVRCRVPLRVGRSQCSAMG
jgi:two-component system, chemotaxis family, sensor kinase CheA